MITSSTVCCILAGRHVQLALLIHYHIIITTYLLTDRFAVVSRVQRWTQWHDVVNGVITDGPHVQYSRRTCCGDRAAYTRRYSRQRRCSQYELTSLILMVTGPSGPKTFWTWFLGLKCSDTSVLKVWDISDLLFFSVTNKTLWWIKAVYVKSYMKAVIQAWKFDWMESLITDSWTPTRLKSPCCM